MNSIELEIYKQELLNLKRGSYKGEIINSKPIFFLCLLRGIERGNVKDNRILYHDKELRKDFKNFSYIYKAEIPKAFEPFFTRPYFHLSSEPFYHIVWKLKSNERHLTQTPTSKFIKDNFEYAKLDDELWNLLQDKGNREYLRDAIINFYFNPQQA